MTNWEKYFGSPENTAITVSSIAVSTNKEFGHGITMPADGRPCTIDNALDLLRWLQNESNE